MAEVFGRGSRAFTLNFTGDVMLGRLVDQLFPQHVTPWTARDSDEARILASFRARHPHLHHYGAERPWASTLPLFRSADLNLINLETAATTHDTPWPHKAFNYRMHPANVSPVLRAACIDFVSLANNHTLDFGPEGLVETVRALQGATVAFAGAGETTPEAVRPAVLQLPRPPPATPKGIAAPPAHAIHVYAAADHPHDWAGVPTFNLILHPSSPATRRRLHTMLVPDDGRDDRAAASSRSTAPPPSLKIFSVHWGPNYAWRPDDEIRALAHFLVDECGVDIVHGHSSHHVQGVERYRGGLLLYGCGDLVDDYAINPTYRNDLGAVWRVRVREADPQPPRDVVDGQDASSSGRKSTGTITPSEDQSGPGLTDQSAEAHDQPPAPDKLRLDRLEIFPTRIETFQAQLLESSDRDHGWVREKITALSAELGTVVAPQLGAQGQLIVDLR
jgi:poly-gamma-glutamate capsule biosynthesis protein CapA/YwtB (metallophosphatase superfamily)